MPNAGPISIGLWRPGAPQSMQPITAFEQQEAMHVGIVVWYETWGDATDGPDMRLYRQVAAHGSVPMVTWEPQHFSRSPSQPVFALNDIAAGKYDDYARKWASAFADFHGRILLRWGHEMNGNWYPWGAGVNGNTPEDYIAAWRHLHDLFVAAGAKNVEWVWCPNVAGSADTPLEVYYPGDQYVDWVALDGYNRARQGWQTFTQLFQDSYNRITAMTDKPFIIGETASGEAENDPLGIRKAAWIQNALTLEIPALFPRVRAVVWFDENKSGVETDGEDWRLITELERRAFARAVSTAPYTGRPPASPGGG